MLASALNSAADFVNGLLGRGGDDWRDNIQTASFRGVEFYAIDSRAAAKHRLIDHLPTYAEQATVEDFGAEPGEFILTGFVAGNKYMGDRDKLWDALNKQGPGPLIDSWRGWADVAVREFEFTESVEGMGVAVFAMTFVPAGLRTINRGSKKDPFSLIGDALDWMNDIVSEITDILKAAGNLARTITAAIKKIKSELELMVKRLESAWENFTDSWEELFGLIATKRETVNDLLAAADEWDEVNETRIQAIQDSLSGLPDWSDYTDLATGTETNEATETEVDRLIQEQSNAITRLFRDSYLALATIAAADKTYQTYDDALAARAAVCTALGDNGRHDLQAGLHDYLTETALSLPRLKSYTPRGPISSLELAYELYGDSERARDIGRRNRLNHTGYIAHDVEVLTA